MNNNYDIVISKQLEKSIRKQYKITQKEYLLLSLNYQSIWVYRNLKMEKCILDLWEDAGARIEKNLE